MALEMPYRIPQLWKEELESNLDAATSANSYSWITKGRITKDFLSTSRLVLNVGCGFGRELAHLPPSTIGLDIDPKLLRIAKQITDRQVVRADALHLPFRNEVFDGVAMAEVIEHLASPLMALVELNRVMTTAGKLVLQTPNRLVTLGVAISRKYGHVHEFFEAELSKYLSSAGFAIARKTGSTIPYIPSTSRLQFLNEKRMFLVWKWINKHFRIITWDIIVLGFKKNEQQ
jgi:SAM-dependent methyltransferase